MTNDIFVYEAVKAAKTNLQLDLTIKAQQLIAALLIMDRLVFI